MATTHCFSTFSFPTLFEASLYAKRYLEDRETAQAVFLEGLPRVFSRDEMNAFLQTAAQKSGEFDENHLKAHLRLLRRSVMLRLIARDLFHMADLSEVVSTVTDLAEITVNYALDYFTTSLQRLYGKPMSETSQKEQKMLVVGMGKLGGRELNVSSDIDLIFVYPEEGETVNLARPKKTISHFEYFTKLAKKLINALHELTGDGFVFRVDMRLRPNGDSGPLVCNFAMLEHYLFTQGREWERYAWIKGRILNTVRCPDDEADQHDLMQIVQPFVFRKYLDYGAYDSMRDLHHQIMQEVQRKDRFNNIKLGPGGIREIEFIAQVFQLIRGGRERSLRMRPTLTVLDHLSSLNLIAPNVVTTLKEAYVLLRNIEHRLQYYDDQQTQTLPENSVQQEGLAQSLGYENYDVFFTNLNRLRQQVSSYFEQILGAPQNDQTQHPLTALWQDLLDQEVATAQLMTAGYPSAEISGILSSLHSIRQSHRYQQLAVKNRTRFDALVPPFLEVAGRFENATETLQRILTLLENISRRESYLALLLEYPQSLNRLAKLCSASPWAAEYLTRQPILLDELIDTQRLYDLPHWENAREHLKNRLLQLEGDVETQLDTLRHFKHAEQFKLIAQDLAGLLSVEALSDHLSLLADIILEEILQIAWKNLKLKHSNTLNFAIIGYGKLGGKELGYASDLDIIFLYDDEDQSASETYARLAQRLNTWMSNVTSAGVLYETDLRLRPNGSSGLLVSTVQAFKRYQEKEAWTWEHQALTRARFAAGNTRVGEQFEHIRTEILKIPRDLLSLKEEILKMREKMSQSHTNMTALFDLKHDRGGIIDVEFIVQYLVLAYSHQYIELTKNSGNIALLETAGKIGLISSELATNVQDAYRFFRRKQHELRLQGNAKAHLNATEITTQIQAVKNLWQQIFS